MAEKFKTYSTLATLNKKARKYVKPISSNGVKVKKEGVEPIRSKWVYGGSFILR